MHMERDGKIFSVLYRLLYRNIGYVESFTAHAEGPRKVDEIAAVAAADIERERNRVQEFPAVLTLKPAREFQQIFRRFGGKCDMLPRLVLLIPELLMSAASLWHRTTFVLCNSPDFSAHRGGAYRSCPA